MLNFLSVLQNLAFIDVWYSKAKRNLKFCHLKNILMIFLFYFWFCKFFRFIRLSKSRQLPMLLFCLSNIALYKKINCLALTRWISWLEHHPVHQKVVGSIPAQGTYLGWWYSPPLGYVQEATNQCLSLTPSLFPFLSF